MNNLKNKTIKQKMILALTIVVILLNFIMPTYSHAKFDWGGTLFSPIQSFICGLGDAVINFLQDKFLEGSVKAIDYRSQAQIDAKGPLASGMADVATWMVDHPILSSVAVGIVTGGVGTVATYAGLKGADLLTDGYFESKPFPLIQYSPIAIFSNKIPAFDINFINPSVGNTGNINQDIQNTKDTLEKKADNILSNNNASSSRKDWANGVKDALKEIKGTDGKKEDEAKKINEKNVKILNELIEKAEDQGIKTSITSYLTTSGSTASILRSTVSKWYTNLRDIAIVGLLSVLVYIGIRILLSSVSQEKAKYKKMLKDWLIGMCLVFFMHYIMVFILNGAQIVTDIFARDGNYDEVMNEVRLLVLSDDLGTQMAASLMYAVMVFYTIMFTWQYFKRTVYMAFLTMIAPLVAFTYPIDKINDGSAQAFNIWFKEYFFNAILQPVHLLLYTILVSSAMSLVETNPIYAIVAIGFISQAEKIIKKMFGFNKAEGGGLAAGVAGAALFSSGVNLLKSGVSAASAHSKGNSGKSGSGSDNKIRFDRTPNNEEAKNLKAFSSGKPGELSSGNSESSNSIGTPENSSDIGLGESSSGIGTGGSSGGAGLGGKSKTLKGNQNGLTQGLGESKYETDFFRKMEGFGNSAKGLAKKPIEMGQNKINGVKDRYRNSNNKFIKGTRDFGKFAGGTKIIRGVKGVGRVAKRYSGKMLKAAPKAIVKGYGAAALATMGVAAGLASDDYSNVFKYGSIGSAAGWAVAGSASDTMLSGGSNVRDTFKQGYYTPEEYQKKLNAKADKQWKKDEDVQRYYKSKYGSQYKEKMNQAMELRQYGVTDQKDIDTGIKLMDKGLDSLKAASIIDFTSNITREQLMDSEQRGNIENYAYNLTGSKEATQQVMNLADQVKKVSVAPKQQTSQQPTKKKTGKNGTKKK